MTHSSHSIRPSLTPHILACFITSLHHPLHNLTMFHHTPHPPSHLSHTPLHAAPLFTATARNPLALDRTKCRGVPTATPTFEITFLAVPSTRKPHGGAVPSLFTPTLPLPFTRRFSRICLLLSHWSRLSRSLSRRAALPARLSLWETRKRNKRRRENWRTVARLRL